MVLWPLRRIGGRIAIVGFASVAPMFAFAQRSAASQLVFGKIGPKRKVTTSGRKYLGLHLRQLRAYMFGWGLVRRWFDLI